jgi:putative membrane protein
LSVRNWNGSGGVPWLSAALLVGGIVAIVAIVLTFAFLARPTWYAGLGYYPWFPFGFFWILPLGFFLIFFLAKWFLWGGWGWRSGYWYQEDALSILSEKYARGEITKEQFEQMKKDLEEAR